MKQYIYNVWLALKGSNPFQQELDHVKERYEKATENFRTLQEMYYKALENNEALSKQRDTIEEQNVRLLQMSKDATNQKQSLQKLVENLRERVSDKDCELKQQGKEYREQVERMKTDYQQRIERYNQQIDRLSNHGKKAKK